MSLAEHLARVMEGSGDVGNVRNILVVAALWTWSATMIGVLQYACAEEGGVVKWWMTDPVYRPYEGAWDRPITVHPVARELAQRLSEHDWPSFIELLDVPDGLREAAARGDRAVLRKLGLSGLHSLCFDTTIVTVEPKPLEFDRRNGQFFFGATREGWLRVAGALYSELPRSVDTPSARPRLPATPEERGICVSDSPTVFAGLEQSSGVILAEIEVSFTPPEGEGVLFSARKRDCSFQLKRVIKSIAGTVPEAQLIDKAPVVTGFDDTGGPPIIRREPKTWDVVRMMAVLPQGDDYVLTRLGPPGMHGYDWEDSWDIAQRALEKWPALKTCDDQIDFFYDLLKIDSNLANIWGFEGLKKAGLGKKPLSKKDMERVRAVLKGEDYGLRPKIQMMITLLPDCWLALRDDFVVLAGSGQYSAIQVELIVEMCVRDGLPDDPENERYLKELRGIVEELRELEMKDQ